MAKIVEFTQRGPCQWRLWRSLLGLYWHYHLLRIHRRFPGRDGIHVSIRLISQASHPAVL